MPDHAILSDIVLDRLPASDFVGRLTELAEFDRAMADARNGLPSVVLVSGDAGIGKTTSVSESADRAGVSLYFGRSTHIGGDTIPLGDQWCRGEQRRSGVADRVSGR